jgi:hypothetical protein
MRQDLNLTLEINEIENVATIAELMVTVLDYERVLRRIGRWSNDEPSVWARQVLMANQRRLDS